MNIYYLEQKKKLEIKTLIRLKDQYDLESENSWVHNYSFHNKIYYYVDKEKTSIYFSKTIKEIKDLFNITIDQDMVFYYKNTGFIVPPFTIYNQIRRITPYQKFTLKDNQLIIENIYPKSGDLKLDIKKFENILKNNIFTEQKNNVITLSGGADSALLTALSSSLNVEAETLTCRMDGFETESKRALKIAKYFGYNNEIFTYNPMKGKEIVTEYLKKTHEPIYDSMLPVITQMLRTKDHSCLIDGQGADSLLLGLPHNRLIDRYHPIFGMLKPAKLALNKLTINKSSRIGRKLFRFKKIVNSVSHQDVYSCILASINFPETPYNQYYNYVKNELVRINNYYNNIQKTIAYFFLFKIVSVREMQKYELVRNAGMHINLPFINKELIEYVFTLETTELFGSSGIKLPVYTLLDKYIPNTIPKNKTSPFYVKLSDYEKNKVNDNILNKNVFPIFDWDCYIFAQENISIINKLNQ